MKKLIYPFLLILPVIGLSQPGTEIYLCDLKIEKNAVSISNPTNITNREGYDNQPSFHSTAPIIYYSTIGEDTRSEIKTYNYKSNETKAFTNTNEREYSPTLTLDGAYISCIIQRDNNAQDLGKYPVAGGEPITIIDNLIIGYHSWVDPDNLILFVLGDTITLQWYDIKKKQNTVLSKNIGRSLHRIPGEKAMSFVDKNTDGEWLIKRMDGKSRKISTITTTVKGTEDLTWTPNGKIIMSDGEKLFFFDTKSPNGWQEINFDHQEMTLKGITRLAVSANGNKIAIVASEWEISSKTKSK